MRILLRLMTVFILLGRLRVLPRRLLMLQDVVVLHTIFHSLPLLVRVAIDLLFVLAHFLV